LTKEVGRIGRHDPDPIKSGEVQRIEALKLSCLRMKQRAGATDPRCRHTREQAAAGRCAHESARR
jgi:hypothetical protein